MAVRRRRPSARIITGITELDAALSLLKTGVANRVARSSLSKGARLSAKKIKAAIPSRYKSVKRSIGSSAKRNRRTKLWEAKAGAAVGKRKASRGGTFGGVGISSKNVHWWFLGTGVRKHPLTGTSGAMPAVGRGIVRMAMAAGGSEVLNAIKQSVREGIEREAVKARARGRSIV